MHMQISIKSSAGTMGMAYRNILGHFSLSLSFQSQFSFEGRNDFIEISGITVRKLVSTLDIFCKQRAEREAELQASLIFPCSGKLGESACLCMYWSDLEVQPLTSWHQGPCGLQEVEEHAALWSMAMLMSPWAASSSSLHTAGKRRDPCADTSTN